VESLPIQSSDSANVQIIRHLLDFEARITVSACVRQLMSLISSSCVKAKMDCMQSQLDHQQQHILKLTGLMESVAQSR
jgi:hypothetical protein